jgi:hypothetical protein
MARRGKARLGRAGHGMARLGQARLGKARRGWARQGERRARRRPTLGAACVTVALADALHVARAAWLEVELLATEHADAELTGRVDCARLAILDVRDRLDQLRADDLAAELELEARAGSLEQLERELYGDPGEAVA